MKVILYIRDSYDHWIEITSASTEQQVNELMRYATYKVSYGYDVKIEHRKDEVKR